VFILDDEKAANKECLSGSEINNYYLGFYTNYSHYLVTDTVGIENNLVLVKVSN
jgi:hypothetical protein